MKFDPDDPAIEIIDPDEARTYFDQIVDYIVSQGNFDRAAAEKLTRHNLGYFAGYYDNDTRERVERLFDCAHPVFGKISEKGPPTPEQAIRAGMNLALGRN